MLGLSPRGLLVFFLVLGLGVPACNSDRVRTFPVRGKILFKSKPVPNGTVMFTPVNGNGPTATGELNSDGTYTLTTYKPDDGAPAGQYKVVVMALEDTSNKLPEDRNPTPPPIVPDKYTSLATTDLTAEVHEGENVCDFTLADTKKR